MNKWVRRILKTILSLTILLVVLVCILWWLTKPPQPDAFYRTASRMPTTPGSLINSEPFTKMVPGTARAWRILYSTTKYDGTIAPASALVIAPKVTSGLPSNVVIWTHGTTGVDPACGPSVMDNPFANVPAFEEAIAEGWVIVATDYIGLGTAGPHPYLIGEGQARSALDSLRALRQLKEVSVTDNTVVWGHSQGGNAALWTGILGPSYAPEQKLNGVMAAAPATDLIDLVRKAQGTPVGTILSAYIVTAYSSTYSDVSFDDNVRSWNQWLVRDMATRCMEGKRALFLVGEALAAGKTIFAGDPTTGNLGKRLRENTPSQLLTTPLFISQGANDELVLPEIQDVFVKDRCAAGQSLEYIRYAGRDHLKLVARDSPLTADLIQWTKERFENKTAPQGCIQTNK